MPLLKLFPVDGIIEDDLGGGGGGSGMTSVSLTLLLSVCLASILSAMA